MLAQAEAMKAEAKDFDPVKAIKEIADLFTPIGDGVRVVTGKDPITGEKLSGGERGLYLLFIIPLAKVGKYGAKGFKFVAEGMEDINKLNKKADKVKEAEKSTKKASGAGTEIGKYSVETLNRDQARTVVENLLDNGEISLKDLQNMVPEGIPNTFKPTDTIKNGAKYEFQLSDGQKAIIRWHEPDPAAAKFPNSASGSSWTAQIKIGNKQVTVDGLWTKKQNSNEVHVPIQGR